MAERRSLGRNDGIGGPKSLRGTWLRELPRRRRHGTRSFPGGSLRNHRSPRVRGSHDRERGVPAPGDLDSERRQCSGVHAPHAVVSRTAQRGADSRPYRLYPFAESRRKTMSATTATPATLPPSAGTRVDYLNANYGWTSWLFTTDHKRIALL